MSAAFVTVQPRLVPRAVTRYCGCERGPNPNRSPPALQRQVDISGRRDYSLIRCRFIVPGDESAELWAWGRWVPTLIEGEAPYQGVVVAVSLRARECSALPLGR